VLESELFGHEAGSFTSAQRARQGRFEQADGGTLFLDEIGDVSPALQVKLLRVLQEREFERVGGNRTVKVDIRIIAATHRDLEAMVKQGTFRGDLFYRLNVVPLQLPPLRERPVDIDALAQHFATRFSLEMGKRVTLSPSALAALRAYDWPGNVRELRNVLERAAVLADPEMSLEAGDLQFDISARPAPAEPAPSGAPAPRPSVFEAIADEERSRIEAALRQAGGSVTRAAKVLGLPRTTLNDRMRKLGLS
jgi:transcriptional regulator with GAF, ATPase, and Fis domain